MDDQQNMRWSDTRNAESDEHDEENEDEARLLHHSYQWHLLALDFLLNPSLSLHAAMAAINSLATSFRTRKQPVITTASVNRFFDEEYLSRLEARHARDRARRERCTHIALLISAILLLVFLLGFLMLVIYCYLKPRSPLLEVVNVQFNYKIMTDVDNAGLRAQQAEGKGEYYAATYNFSITYTVNVRNPNKRVDLYVNSLWLSPFYYGFQLGQGTAPAFRQPRGSSSRVNITTVEAALPVPLKENYSIKRDMMQRSIDFVVEMRLKARMSTVLGIRSPLFWSNVKCDITLCSTVAVRC